MSSIEKVLYVSSKAMSNTSLFNIELHPALDIDLHRKAVYLSCLHMEFKNNVYNIGHALGNNILRYHDGTAWSDYIIPSGCYTIEQLNDLLANDDTILARFIVGMNTITKRVDIRFKYSGYKIDFNASRLNEVLGFDADIYPGALQASVANQYITASNVAKINPVSVAFVHSSLSNTTSAYNGLPSNIIDSVPIGNDEHIILAPTNPIRVDCSAVIGTIVDNIQFWLSDQDNNILSLNGEVWTGKFLLEIF